jgi:dihydrofolate synthase/folylpolyglutamate synthase
VIATAAVNPRARSPEELAATLSGAMPGLPVTTRERSGEAMAAALALATPRDLVCVAGNLYLAGEALRWLAAQPATPPSSIRIAGVDHP